MQRWNDVDSTLIQHQDVESTLNRRCFKFVYPLGWLHSHICMSSAKLETVGLHVIICAVRSEPHGPVYRIHRIMCNVSIWATTTENVPSDMCAQLRLKSAGTSAQSGFTLFVWRNLVSLAFRNAPSEDSDHTAPTHRLIWIFTGCTCSKVCFLTTRLRY